MRHALHATSMPLSLPESNTPIWGGTSALLRGHQRIPCACPWSCADDPCSGHGAFWVLAPLCFRSYYARPAWPTVLLWIALAQTSIRDVIDQQHYSVDMLLAVIVTASIWSWADWVCPGTVPLPRRSGGTPGDRPHPLVLAVVVFGLATAAVVVFVAKS